MSVYDTLKKATSIIWKNEEFKIGDLTTDWVELVDKRGIPVILKLSKVKKSKANGKTVSLTTEGNVTAVVIRLHELANIELE